MGRGLLLFTFLVIISINSSLAAECHQTYIDLVLIQDASGSMEFENFQNALQFMQEFISKLAIDEGNVRVGIVVFGSQARVEFNLSRFNRREEILDAISNIDYDNAYTNVAAALRLTRTDVFTLEGGDRENATNVAVLIADGEPNREVYNTDDEAKKLKDSGVRIIVLAITSYPEMFAAIASAPTSENIISIDRFSQLDSVHSTLYSSVCKECHHTYIDLVLIVDVSNSTEMKNFRKQLQFMQEFISKLAIDEGNVRVGIVVFGSQARVEFSLTRFNRREEILDAISNIDNNEEHTNVAAALRLTRTDVFTLEGGDRENATNVAVLIADGGPNREVNNTDDEAKKLKDSGVRIIVLAITSYPEKFATFASAPKSDNVISIDRFSQLDSVHSTLYNSVCKVGTASPTGTKTATKSGTTRTSATKSTSDSTTNSASITDTTPSQITTITTATTSTSTTSIAPVSTTTIRSTSNITPTTPTQDKATPTTTPTTHMVTNPTATTNTTGSSTSVPGRVNVSGGVTATITAALQTCYDRCASPVGATSTLFNAIRSLRLEKEDLSKQRREKTSASDVRPSATIVATLVLAIVWTPILVLVIWDLIDLCRNRHI